MKRVVFIRHAKSSWKDAKLNDVERPLAKRGKSDLEKIGPWLKNSYIIPDLIVTSNAKRAKQTAVGLAAHCGYLNEIVVNEDLYFKGSSAIIRLINQFSETLETVFLVSHNPDINEIVIKNFKVKEENIPTLGCVFTRSKAEKWSHWNFENTVVENIVKPKNF